MWPSGSKEGVQCYASSAFLVKKLDYFLQGGPYVELFSYLSSVTLLCCILPHFGVLCMRQVEQYYVAVNVQYVLGVDT